LKTSRKLIIIAVVLIIGVLSLFAYEATLSSPGSSKWIPAANYPLQVSGSFAVAGQQCVNSTGYIYCVGGQDALGGPRNEVYSSVLSTSSLNITSWTPEPNPYPQNIHGQSCVAYIGYAYCVGGTYDDGGDDTASSYYAFLGGNGVVGSWNPTTAFPIPIDSQYCAASSGDIYCVGGNNETDGTNADSTASSSVWYAPLSSSGIGAWSLSTPYPANLYFPSCFASTGYIYCLGGADQNNNAQSTDYYAALSSTGVGAWTQTTSYPIQASGQACGFSSGYIYCVGGQEGSNSYTNAVYYAAVSSGGIGGWKQAGTYPLSVGTTCAISSGYMYCMGGFDDSSQGDTDATYYVPLTTLSNATASG
jgi:hypothetical protein